MAKLVKELYQYRELILTLAWKEITVRYKQAYFGLAWAVMKPLALMLIFTLVKSVVGIETGDLPYPLMAFAALIPWIFFQESVSDGIGSIVNNAALIKKIYIPRLVFPLTSVVTKLLEMSIGLVILAGLMLFYQWPLSLSCLWLIPLILYTVVVAFSLSLLGASINVYYRDVASMLPIMLSLLMYASPVIYPLSLVKKALLEQQALGEWSDLVYQLYIMNPLAGIIESFQRALYQSASPDWHSLLPGALLVAVMFPVSILLFRRAERNFADVI